MFESLEASSSTQNGDNGRVSSESPAPYVIVIHPTELELDDIGRALEDLGVRIDGSFPPIPLGGGNVMIRGSATESAVQRARSEREVEFFPDLPVQAS